jgi:uncharacterized membrane protein HdeD (DUF308 family)
MRREEPTVFDYTTRQARVASTDWAAVVAGILLLAIAAFITLSVANAFQIPPVLVGIMALAGLVAAATGLATGRNRVFCGIAAVLHLIVGVLLWVAYVLARAIPTGH